MKHSLAILVFAFCLVSTNCFADVPPCWCSFEKESNNKQFVAAVTRPVGDSLKDSWRSEWTLTVYEKIEGGRKMLWTAIYDYSGYPDGFLSNDGKSFVYIEGWYYPNSTLVLIYNEGLSVKTNHLTGLAFKIPEQKLGRSVSHQLWLKEETYSTVFKKDKNNQLYFEIITIDNVVHRIRLKDGQFINPVNGS